MTTETVADLSAEEKEFFGDAAVEPAPPSDPPTIETVEPPKEDPAPAEPDQGQNSKYVPLAALHEERERRRELTQQLQTQAERSAQLELTVGQIISQFRGGQQAEAPTPDSDPIAVLKQLAQKVGEFDQWKQHQAQLSQQQQQEQQFRSAVSAQETEFRKTSPDYDESVRFLVDTRNKELELYGITDPAQRQNMIEQEAIAIAANALRANKNPAAQAYELAKMRGFAGKAPAPAPDVKPAQQKLDTIERGQAAAASLGSAPGSATSKVTLETLAGMSDKEFAEATSGDRWRELWGG